MGKINKSYKEDTRQTIGFLDQVGNQVCLVGMMERSNREFELIRDLVDIVRGGVILGTSHILGQDHRYQSPRSSGCEPKIYSVDVDRNVELILLLHAP